MSRFSIEHEWLTGTVSSSAPELQATWARLSIRVDRGTLLLGHDTETSASRDSLVVPLYPLAEWIAFNWWQLFDNSRPPTRSGIDARSMRSAGDGYLWPNLSFIPSGDSIRLVATPISSIENEYVVFDVEFQQWVDAGEVRQRFVDLVESVLQRLDRAGVNATALHEEWRRLQALDTEEEEFCRTAAQLGLDPLSEGVELAESIERAFADLPSELAAEFASSAAVDRLDESASWVNALVTELETALPPMTRRLR